MLSTDLVYQIVEPCWGLERLWYPYFIRARAGAAVQRGITAKPSIVSHFGPYSFPRPIMFFQCSLLLGKFCVFMLKGLHELLTLGLQLSESLFGWLGFGLLSFLAHVQYINRTMAVQPALHIPTGPHLAQHGRKAQRNQFRLFSRLG